MTQYDCLRALVTTAVVAVIHSPVRADVHCAPQSLTIGYGGICVLRGDAQVACFATGDPTNYVTLSARSPGTFSQIADGGDRTCGLRPDGSVDCWGENAGQLVPPGTLGTLSMSLDYGCGVRPDLTAFCTEQFAHPTPEDTEFLDIATGGPSVCGRRVDQKIECWGSDPVAPPAGSYSQISGAYDATFCGVVDNGHLQCWGPAGHEGELNPPPGKFIKVRVSSATSACALDEDGHITCWGEDELFNIPAGAFADIAVFRSFVCGIRADGEVVCNHDFGTKPLVGQFVEIAAGGDAINRPITCAIDFDGHLACTGRYGFNQAFSGPEGIFRKVSLGNAHGCAIRHDRSIQCWGVGGPAEHPPETGSYVDVSAGIAHTCALDVDGQVHCWGFDGVEQVGPPEGEFVQISSGFSHVCALAADGEVTCRQFYEPTPNYLPPAGPFTKISAAKGYAAFGSRSMTCGIRPDRTVACWGEDVKGLLDVPAGGFLDVEAGANTSCGIRLDGSIECWGGSDAELQSPPSGFFTRLAVGPQHACALEPDGDIQCWGLDQSASFCANDSLCGNSHIDGDEECDEGVTEMEPGMQCTIHCKLTKCGQPVSIDAPEPLASDALLTLEAAVDFRACEIAVCDVNQSSDVTATDALLILRKAVGLDVTLNCFG